MNWAIGVDVGGTAIKGVAARDDGKILYQESFPTNDYSDTVDQWSARVRKIIDIFSERLNAEASAIGICSPGLASTDRRCIAYLPGKLQGLEGFDWTKALNRKTTVPVVNDAHSALLGEIWVGSVAGMKDVVLLTL
ncbi:MAG: ROK family protein, partial [Verrucomicrobiae bacterium]|nr:ROK family protein [Verrucomicrobiae bacterium]